MRVLPLVATALASVALPQTQADIPRACEGNFTSLPFCNTSLSTPERVADLLARISLHDKVLMLTARASPRGSVPDIGLPEYNWGANCVHGVQSTCGTNCATSFPNPVNFGAIFDPEAAYDMAQVIGWELRALWLEGARENYKAGPHLGLDCWSPNININRDPRWGRNMETPSEDPLVNSLYGVAYTRGLQEGKDPKYLQAVVTLKHWMAYSYENYGGVDRQQFNAIVSRYDFADTYFPAFRTAVVDGKAKGVMCSYNALNGVPMCSNDNMTAVLRNDLGYEGYITSDSGAIRGIFANHHYTKSLCEAGMKALKSGTDINSGSVYEECLEKLVHNKQLDEKYLDDAIRRTLTLRFELGLLDPIEDQPYWHVAPSEVNKPSSQALALETARKSLVLLQNHNQTLPLRKGANVAVIGPHALSREGIMGNYYGQICHGDYKELGCVQTPFEAIQAANGDKFTTKARGCGMNDTSTAGFAEAAAIAKNADVVVLFLGIDTTVERESYDRDNINLPNIQLQLLKRIRKVGKPMVVVLFNGGIVGTEEIILYTDSLVEAFYPGFYGAKAVADVLFGDYNPGGKLPVTMYRSNYVDSVKMKSMSMTDYPGRSYRYFKEVPVFPFGWGLSYTTFSLDAADSETPGIPKIMEAPHNATFEITVRNTGTRTGDEVVFGFFRPLSTDATGSALLLNQQLFVYKRVTLKPKQSKQMTFTVDPFTLGLCDENGDLIMYPGLYEIIFTNGVSERRSFMLHLIGKQRVLRPFPASASMGSSKTGSAMPVPPVDSAVAEAIELVAME